MLGCAAVDDRLDHILALAWRIVPAADANEAIEIARRMSGSPLQPMRGAIMDADNEVTDPGLRAVGDAPQLRAYEIALGPDATFDSFAREQLPRLVYHLESIGAHLPQARGVLLCVFAQDKLHFLEAGEAIEEICLLLGTTPEELTRLHGTGEIRTAVRGPQMALPPPPKSEN